MALAALLLVGARGALAADEPVPPDVGDITDLSLEDLLSGLPLRRAVTVSTKTPQRAAQTPAVITVVTGAEIGARGYRTLAEVLRSVPGFYDVYDLVHHNVGVRGINGGPRAAGNVIKLMIDGHPVDYRPTTGNFFGEELVPIEAVERIEILRGPASALYGANAFLGVVNVVTRSGKSLGGLHVLGGAAFVRRHPGFGVGALLGHAGGPLDLLIGASMHRVDRSGRALPGPSPPPGDLRARGRSQGDVARPASAIGKLQLKDVLGGTLQLTGSLQRLDAAGEFQDFGALTHTTRIAMVNQNYRLGHESHPAPWLALRLSGHHFRAGPGAEESLDIGRDDYLLVRAVGATGFGLAAEAQATAGGHLTLTAGLDQVSENHLLQTFSQRYRRSVLNRDGSSLIKEGTVIPNDRPSDRRTLRNFGAFVQGVVTIRDDWSLTGGARVDLHNVYGARPNGRVGLVYAPPARTLSVKLLYGSSFKAPSAEQLYTQPMKALDIRGNPELEPQTAHTFELFAGFGLPDGQGEISMNAFVTKVTERVEYQQLGRFQTAFNIDEEWIVGGELDGRLALSKALNIRLSSAIARSVSKVLGNAIPPGTPEVTNSLFPVIQCHLALDYALPWWSSRAAMELSYVGARTSSQSNALNHGGAYQVPGYLFVGVALSIPARRWFGDRETSFVLRINDALDRRWTEPGFGGFDVPSPGLTTWLTIDQQL